MALSALLLTTLSGCAASGIKTTGLPPLPADLKTCFNDTVPRPSEGTLTKGETMQLIAALKRSETSKTFCGQRMIQFYESLT